MRHKNVTRLIDCVWGRGVDNFIAHGNILLIDCPVCCNMGHFYIQVSSKVIK